ncbi:CLUMA_CG017083, isoform A [Clunio marinus]|uniref:CLUMA_CG017083, isoform A n=1 Tax=Clunio marinus TaxID=568069 RepID=A0A1J1IW87_9DIPT|nr:CLUMA_CG017083, isoform A [Clunio marinus]
MTICWGNSTISRIFCGIVLARLQHQSHCTVEAQSFVFISCTYIFKNYAKNKFRSKSKNLSTKNETSHLKS